MTTPATTTRMRPALVGLLAVTTGLSVANLYYAQPLLDDIRHSLHLSNGTAGLIVSASQAGYVAGLLFVVPLGDLLQRRRLIPGMIAALAVCLAAIGAAPGAPVLFVATVAVGVLSVVAQMGVAFAASLAGDQERGKVVGTVMSGLLLGILLARTAAGYLASWGTWRTPFFTAAGVMVVLAVLLWFTLPAEQAAPAKQADGQRPAQQTDGQRPAQQVDGQRSAQRYTRLLVSVVTLVREERTLRRRSLLGACAFGAFSSLWTPLTFLLTGSPYHYSTATIGLFGLLGAMGAASASFAGRLADKGGAHVVTGVTAALLLLSWLPIGLGAHWLPGLVIGVLVLDLAVQGLHITNQSEIYVLRPEARSRLTSAYMTIYFTGGVIGSVGSAFAYTHGGWVAVCVLGAAFGLVATVLWAIGPNRRGAGHAPGRREPLPTR